MQTDTIATTAPNTQLAAAVHESGLSPDSAKNLISEFGPSFTHAMDLAAQATDINVTDATQVTEIKKSKALRLQLKAVRVEAEKIRKRLKEESLRTGKGIDKVHSVIESIITPAEEKMKAQEEFAERVEAQRRAELAQKRAEMLRPYVQDPSIYPLGDMNDASFQSLLTGQRLAKEQAEAAARKAEEDRIAKEQAEAAERERLRVENERLKAEREAVERQMAEERRVAEEAARKAAETARKEREAAEAQARAEREARERVEREAAEAARKAEAERAAKAEAEAAEKRRAEMAPDAEKLRALARSLESIAYPDVASKEAKRVIAIARESVAATVAAIVSGADRLTK